MAETEFFISDEDDYYYITHSESNSGMLNIMLWLYTAIMYIYVTLCISASHR